MERKIGTDIHRVNRVCILIDPCLHYCGGVRLTIFISDSFVMLLIKER